MTVSTTEMKKVLRGYDTRIKYHKASIRRLTILAENIKNDGVKSDLKELDKALIYCAEHFNIDVADLIGAWRLNNLVEARIMFTKWAAAKGFTRHAIAKRLNKDRSTIFYYLKKWDDHTTCEEDFSRKYEAFKSGIDDLVIG